MRCDEWMIPEYYVIQTPTDHKIYFCLIQRNFAGNRYSDHMAALNAFSCWEEARQAGENAEINFCDSKGLNMPTMRTTW